MLICLEILKQWNIKHPIASRWGAFMDISNITNHSPFLYKPTNDKHKKFMTSKYQNTTFINNNC